MDIRPFHLRDVIEKVTSIIGLRATEKALEPAASHL